MDNSLSIGLLLLAQLCSTWGFWLLGAVIVRKAMRPVLHLQAVNRATVPLHLLPLAVGWGVSFGLRGLLSSWAYHLDIPPLWPTYSSAAIGITLSIMLREEVRSLFFPACQGSVKETAPGRNWGQLVGVATVVIALVAQLLRVPAPWWDGDEVVIYGLLTKLLSQGWTYSDVVGSMKAWSYHSTPPLIESLDAQLYMIANATWLVRLGRVLLLAATASAGAAFLGCFGLPAFLCWASGAIIVSTPDLSTLGTSLKVDTPIMLLEFSAFLMLSFAWLILLDNKKTGRTTSAIPPALLAVFLSLCAVAARQSSAYCASLCVASLLCFEWTEWKTRKTYERSLVALSLLWLVGACGIHYWMSWIYYGNPLFPIQAPWPFSSLPYMEKVSDWKALYNVCGWPGLLQLYLLPYLAFGLDKHALPAIFPHPVQGGSVALGWLSPTILSILLLPFYRVKPLALVLGSIFIVQYVVWSSGVQYSRVFLGTAMLCCLLCAYMMSEKPQDETCAARLARLTASGIFIVSLVVQLGLAVRWGHYRALSTLPLLMCQKSTHDYSVELLATHTGVRQLPIAEDCARIDAALLQWPKPVVLVRSKARGLIHILFQRGFFLGDQEAGAAGDALLIGPDADNLQPPPEFPVLLVSSGDHKWRLYGKSL